MTAARHSSGGRSTDSATTVGPRDHHGRDLLVGEVEDLVEHLLLLLLDLALLGRAREEHLQLGLRVDAAFLARRLEPEQAERAVGGRLEHPDQRLEDEEERADRARDRERGRLRMAEGDALRDQLADDHVEVGDQQEREEDGDDRRRDRVEDVREDGLAQGTDGQARERDAELHRGDEAVRVRRDAQDGACAPVALVAELGDARSARRDEAVFGRDEERVQQEQRGDREQLERNRHAPLTGATVLGGWSSSSNGDRL